ncbi:hypothetical protein [Millisia brevis]|uniref:hypothetical protein n=1 Tax=Millisia brevis TaxID=264148 RepID=UPI0012EE4F06|nr:hypothetical protein [Millisia brevis]
MAQAASTRRSRDARGERTRTGSGALTVTLGGFGVLVEAPPFFKLQIRQLLPAQHTSRTTAHSVVFTNQNSACRLRQEFTLERLTRHFHLDDEGA